VQFGAEALGFGLDRQLTVTGGLTFAGGPGNNYVTHSIASMVDVLRADPESLGLVTALGWYATKHSLGLYSTRPPATPFRARSVQDEVDALPRREIVADHDGPATVESFTVMHERDGSPSLAIVACLTPDGGRTWANSTDPSLMTSLLTEDLFGREAKLSTGGAIQVL
jgi:acetyl-CoA C-acetyltransferase